MVLHHVCFHIRKSADITLICSSPQLIAACHVLHRLLMPRHSPYALFCLNFLFGSHILELLEFQNMGFIFSHLKGFPFSALFNSTLRWNRSILLPSISGKTLIFLTLQSLLHLLISKSRLFSLLSVRFYTLSLFGFQWTGLHHNQYCDGRSGWTRTTDLALIRRAL